jgi:hypothetical protein
MKSIVVEVNGIVKLRTISLKYPNLSNEMLGQIWRGLPVIAWEVDIWSGDERTVLGSSEMGGLSEEEVLRFAMRFEEFGQPGVVSDKFVRDILSRRERLDRRGKVDLEDLGEDLVGEDSEEEY